VKRCPNISSISVAFFNNSSLVAEVLCVS
jgi:hypothetical protein